MFHYFYFADMLRHDYFSLFDAAADIISFFLYYFAMPWYHWCLMLDIFAFDYRCLRRDAERYYYYWFSCLIIIVCFIDADIVLFVYAICHLMMMMMISRLMPIDAWWWCWLCLRYYLRLMPDIVYRWYYYLLLLMPSAILFIVFHTWLFDTPILIITIFRCFIIFADLMPMPLRLSRHYYFYSPDYYCCRHYSMIITRCHSVWLLSRCFAIIRYFTIFRCFSPTPFDISLICLYAMTMPRCLPLMMATPARLMMSVLMMTRCAMRQPMIFRFDFRWLMILLFLFWYLPYAAARYFFRCRLFTMHD